MIEVIEWLRHSYKGNFQPRVLMIMHITNASSKMSELQLAIFNHQLVEYNNSEISQILHIPRTTIQDAVKKIRRIVLRELI